MVAKIIPKEVLVCLLLLLVWGIYLKTMAPDIYTGDSGALITVVYSEGITHPAGSPLYSLLGGIFTKLALGNIAWRTNLLSATGAVLCLLFVYHMLQAIFPHNSHLALAGVFFLCGQSQFWEKAVTSEVYAWQLFFTALLFFLLFSLTSSNEPDPQLASEISGQVRMKGISSADGLIYSQPSPQRASGVFRRHNKDHYLLALVFVIACGLHVTIVFLLPIFLIYIFLTDFHYQLKYYILISLFGCMALVLYLHLPIRAVKFPLINWGNPQKLPAFLFHVLDRKDSGALYSHDLGFMWRQLKGFAALTQQQYMITGLIIVFGGAIVWVRKKPMNFWLFFLAILPYIIFYSFGNKIVVSDNFSAVFLLFLPFWVNGIHYLENWAINIHQQGKLLFSIFLVVYLTANLGLRVTKNNLRHYYLTYDFIDNIMFSLPPEAKLKTRGDTISSGLAYFQKTLGKRRDLSIFGLLPFEIAPPFRKAPLFSIGGAGAEQGEPRGLVSFFQEEGINQPQKEPVWRYFRQRGPAFDLDCWTDEINAYYALYRGDYLRANGRLSQAATIYEKASRYGDYYSWISSNIGWRFLQMGKLKMAEREFKRFIRLDPTDPSAYNNLGNVYFRLREYELAEKNYRLAINITPGSKLVQRNLQLVQKLKRRQDRKTK